MDTAASEKYACSTLSKTEADVSTAYKVLLFVNCFWNILIANIFNWILVFITVIFLHGFSYLNHIIELCICTDTYAVHSTNYKKMHTLNPTDMECRRFSLSTFRSVDVSVCRRFGLSTFWLWTFRFVDVLVVDASVCRHFDQLTFILWVFVREDRSIILIGTHVLRFSSDSIYHISHFGNVQGCIGQMRINT